jgi:flagellar basal-body rod protein FlgG
MNKAMYAAASGMAAEQAKLDLIAGNLSNADAVGFKSSAMEFAELTDGTQTLGTTQRGTQVVFAQGKLMKSGGPFDLAIDGAGFFAVKREDGSTAYTRDGRFSRRSGGSLGNADGCTLTGVKIPEDATNATVDASGTVYADVAAGKHQRLGRIAIALFASPEGMHSLGGTTFAATQASGHARSVMPGEQGAGKLAFGMLEKSNVSIMTEMMEVLSAQRAFEANSKGVQAADEMQRIANNINRGT